MTDSLATGLGVTAGRGVGRLSAATVVVGGAIWVLVVVTTVSGRGITVQLRSEPTRETELHVRVGIVVSASATVALATAVVVSLW